ncbi:MAG: hypothetical protein LIO94_05305 [Clostridiales bacterium]|nr:hypothetical protein [Clostridiales bacterium]
MEQVSEEYYIYLEEKVSYVGLAEEYIGKTTLGESSSTVRHNTKMVNWKAVQVQQANIF